MWDKAAPDFPQNNKPTRQRELYGGENNSPASNHAPKYRKNSVKEQNTTQIPLSNFVKRRRERLKISIYSHYREKQFPRSYAFIVATYYIAVNKNGKKAKPEKRVNGQKTSPKIALHGPAAAFFLPAQARSRKESHGVYRHLDSGSIAGRKSAGHSPRTAVST